MTRRPFLQSLTAVAAVVAASSLLWTGIRAEQNEPPPDQPRPGNARAAEPGELTKTLGGPDRYLTHLSTDKPLYKPGEKLYLRGVVLHAARQTPLDANWGSPARVQIQGPKGETVHEAYAKAVDSVVGFSWEVPAGTAGGEYKVKVSWPAAGFSPASRTFQVRAYRAPRLKTQIEFVRDGYGPGDVAGATLEVSRAEGGFPANAKVTVQARVDGEVVYSGITSVDLTGHATARFTLPEKMHRGEGTLAFIIEDGGVVETATKTIPILLQTVDIRMYPEGGDLVAGLANRLYLEARTPAGKPADIAGVIEDASGKQLGTFRTEHEGRGRCRFTPPASEPCVLRITEPAGINRTFPIPAAKPAGVVLTSRDLVSASTSAVRFDLSATQSQTLTVTLRQRDVVLGTQEVKVEQGTPSRVAFQPKAPAAGVLVATVTNADGLPLAERLVFRQPSGDLRVSVTADRARYSPGGQVTLTVQTTDANGKPVPATVGLTVTDDSVLELIEKREQAPALPVQVYLEPEVRELADAHVYLDPQNPEAPLAVDLLLGTQGWRRFALLKPAEFLAEHGDDARRALALRMTTARDLSPRGRMFFGRAAGQGGAVPGAVLDAAAEAAPAEARAEKAAAPPKPGVKRPNAGAPGKDQAIREGKPGRRRPAGPAADPAAERDADDIVGNGRRPAARPAESKKREELRKAIERADKNVNGKRLLRQEVAGDALLAREAMPWVVVREYAHKSPEAPQKNQRFDFTETICWQAGLKTDEKTGKVSVSFDVNHAITGFRVRADAFNAGGSLAAASELIESVEPFYTEPKLPLEVTSGDTIELPLSLVNGTPEPLSAGTLSVRIGDAEPVTLDGLQLAGDARVRRLLSLKAGSRTGELPVLLSAQAGPYTDQVRRSLKVVPRGFPQEINRSGMLDADGKVTHAIELPRQIVAGSLTARVAVHPTPLASLTDALTALIRQPYGCFEQTSSSTFPLVMAQQYFRSHVGVDPQLIERSSAMLDAGYQRLTGFECKSGGYEWFGADPGHEALTAYGLLEFTEMSRVREVDSAMLQRTRQWLLGQRDGKGGFKRERRALHTWLADADVSNAYITWALLSAGETDLAAEIDQVASTARTSENSYVIALSTNVLLLAGRTDEARPLLEKLALLQTPAGDVTGGTKSIVGSGGEALTIETTALATLAWLADPDSIDFADKGIRYLSGVCRGGRFGSTQSTVLALQAILGWDKATSQPKAPGSLQLLVDGQPVGAAVPFDRSTQGAIELPGLAEKLTPGRHTVEVQMTDGSRMPHTVAVEFHTEQPVSSADCVIDLSVGLANGRVKEGEVTEAEVTVRNTSDETVPNPIAIIGLPGGLEPRHDQLRELVKAGRIAAWEVRGRDVVLYWRALEAGQTVKLPISAVAEIPGQYTGPASRAYLYYTDEHRQWAEPLAIVIEPRDAGR